MFNVVVNYIRQMTIGDLQLLTKEQQRCIVFEENYDNVDHVQYAEYVKNTLTSYNYVVFEASTTSGTYKFIHGFCGDDPYGIFFVGCGWYEIFGKFQNRYLVNAYIGFMKWYKERKCSDFKLESTPFPEYMCKFPNERYLIVKNLNFSRILNKR
jgi:hypothetical protein